MWVCGGIGVELHPVSLTAHIGQNRMKDLLHSFTIPLAGTYEAETVSLRLSLINSRRFPHPFSTEERTSVNTNHP